jgi:hypothetical protein
MAEASFVGFIGANPTETVLGNFTVQMAAHRNGDSADRCVFFVARHHLADDLVAASVVFRRPKQS